MLASSAVTKNNTMNKHHWLHIFKNGDAENDWVVDDVSHYHDSAGIVFQGTRDDAIIFAHELACATGSVIDSIKTENPLPRLVINDNMDEVFADVQKYISALALAGHSGPIQYAIVILSKQLQTLAGTSITLWTLEQLKELVIKSAKAHVNESQMH